jgi:hypothetical protein
MRSVTGTPGKSENQQQPGDTNKKDSKRGAEKSRKTHHDIDSSDESRSEESFGEGGKKAPKMNSKQPPKSKDKEVRVAPNSTTYSPPSSTDPRVRPSSKRDAFQGKVKREQEVGKQHPHRRRETDLKENHPELRQLKKSQQAKEMENAPARLDSTKLVEKAKAAGGHLEVHVVDEKDANVLSDVLLKNPFIRSLRLRCDLGGNAANSGEQRTKLSAALEAGKIKPDSLDEKYFKKILEAGRRLEALDLRGCRLQESSWIVLKDSLVKSESLRQLTLGDGDCFTYDSIQKSLATILYAGNIQKLTLENIETSVSPVDFLIYHHQERDYKNEGIIPKNYLSLNLINVKREFIPLGIADVILACFMSERTKIQQLSVTGCKLSVPEIRDSIYGGGRTYIEWASNTRWLRVLDLSNCDLSLTESEDLATLLMACPALEEVKLQGTDISESSRLAIQAHCDRNREANLKKREKQEDVAAAAFGLLVENAAVRPDTWPPELSGVLAQNSPTKTLDALASLIGEDPASKSDKRGSNILKPSEPGS